MGPSVALCTRMANGGVVENRGVLYKYHSYSISVERGVFAGAGGGGFLLFSGGGAARGAAAVRGGSWARRAGAARATGRARRTPRPLASPRASLPAPRTFAHCANPISWFPPEGRLFGPLPFLTLSLIVQYEYFLFHALLLHCPFSMVLIKLIKILNIAMSHHKENLNIIIDRYYPENPDWIFFILWYII